MKFEKNKEVEESIQFSTAQWFTSQILRPTRMQQHEQSSLIDNVFINFEDLICTSGDFTESATDQLPNFLIIENINFKLKIKEKIVKRDFSKFSKEN